MGFPIVLMLIIICIIDLIVKGNFEHLFTSDFLLNITFLVTQTLNWPVFDGTVWNMVAHPWNRVEQGQITPFAEASSGTYYNSSAVYTSWQSQSLHRLKRLLGQSLLFL